MRDRARDRGVDALARDHREPTLVTGTSWEDQNLPLADELPNQLYFKYPMKLRGAMNLQNKQVRLLVGLIFYYLTCSGATLGAVAPSAFDDRALGVHLCGAPDRPDLGILSRAFVKSLVVVGEWENARLGRRTQRKAGI